MRGSSTQRSTPAMAQPIRVEVEDEEVLKGAAKSRMHKRSGGQKRSPKKVRVRTVTAGMRQNPSAAKRSKKKKTTRARF